MDFFFSFSIVQKSSTVQDTVQGSTLLQGACSSVLCPAKPQLSQMKAWSPYCVNCITFGYVSKLLKPSKNDSAS